MLHGYVGCREATAVLKTDFRNSLMVALFLLNRSCGSPQELKSDVAEDALCFSKRVV